MPTQDKGSPSLREAQNQIEKPKKHSATSAESACTSSSAAPDHPGPQKSSPSNTQHIKVKKKHHITNHPLIQTFNRLEGNPKVCLLTEPLWGIPYNLFFPFFALYMSSLGVTDQQIGFRMTLGMLLQILTSFLGGAITDKLGRRRTTVIFDTIAWVLPSILYVFAQDYRYFIIGAMLNAVFQVTAISWNCLLVEDADSNELVNIFTWVTLAGLMSVFFAPLASLLVSQIGLDLSMRILIGIFAISMTVKVIVTHRYSKETGPGRLRMEASKDVPFHHLLRGYASVFRSMLKEPATRIVLIMMVLLNLTIAVTNNFFSLFAIQNLGLPEHYAGYFPIARAIIMLIFIYTIQTRLNRLPFKIPMSFGLILYLGAQLALIFAPHAPYVLVALYVLLDSFAYALVIPQRDGLSARILDPVERARSLAIIQMVTQGVTAPFLTLVGFLSAENRIYPFILNFIAFALTLVLILRYGDALDNKSPHGIDPDEATPLEL